MAFGAAGQSKARQAWIAAAILAVIGLLIRFPHFGNPSLHMDEEFYLLVGDRMLHGELPYVDFWDRKPLGLFLIYAATRMLGGVGIVQYQLVATGFAVGTAFIIRSIARRWSSELAGTLAGIIYLSALEPLGGGGGQSPVFYNPFMALAGYCTVRAGDFPDGTKRFRYACGAMALCGLAIQVKYTVTTEGIAFGLILLWQIWSADKRIGGVILAAAAMVGLALAPTLIAFGTYAAIGQADLFLSTNFLSIFRRGTAPSGMSLLRVDYLSNTLLILILAAAFGLVRMARAKRREVGFILLWLAAAALGFVSVGNYFDHYALPLLVPLTIAAAAAFDRRPIGLALAGLAIVVTLVVGHYPDLRTTRSTKAQIGRLGEDVQAHLGGGCLYVHDGPTILYFLLKACHPTRYVFPQHLNYLAEEWAIGVDTGQEMRRLLATKPTVIVTSNNPISDPNEETKAILKAALARDYQLVARDPFNGRDLLVYALSAKRGSAMAPDSTLKN